MLRGKRRAFECAVQGIRNCKNVGQKVGLRLTLTRQTVRDLDAIFDFIDKEGIERVCFHHLVPAGRGRGQVELSHADSRHALRTIARRCRLFNAQGDRREIYTADNYTDGPFFYRMLLEEGRLADALRVHKTLAESGGGRPPFSARRRLVDEPKP